MKSIDLSLILLERKIRYSIFNFFENFSLIDVKDRDGNENQSLSFQELPHDF